LLTSLFICDQIAAVGVLKLSVKTSYVMLACYWSSGLIIDAADGYSDVAFEKMKVVVGLELLQPSDVGVFHYEQTDGEATHQSKCAVLSNHGTKVRTDRGFVVFTF